MIPHAPSDDVLLRRLVEHNDESATAALFLHLYRASPELRHWLREDFARDIKLRRKLDGLARAETLPTVVRFAELTQDNDSWQTEREHLKKQMSGRFYGGRTWNEVIALVHHYQAGTLDLGAFLLVREWREAGRASPALLWAGFALLESVLPSGRRRLLKHLHAALAFVKKFENRAQQRAAVGYTDWWKLHTLYYILRHPRPAYRTRDLRAHLTTLGLSASTKDMRRFCARHGINRDMRAGRPRKNVPNASTVSRAKRRSNAA
jgi:hypothetical protein